MSLELTFENVVRAVLDARIADVHTALPAKVISYDATNQVADVQPLVKDVYEDAAGVLRTRSYPTIPSVPVAFLRGGGYFVSLPLSEGDTGMLIFCELPIDRWRSTGQESHPVNARRHGVGNAVFYPGVSPRAKALAEAGVDDHLVLGKEGGCQVHVTAALVNIAEESAADFVALAAKVATELTRIQTDLTALKSAVTAGFTAVTPTGGGPAALSAFNSAASAVPSSPSSVAATKVKAT